MYDKPQLGLAQAQAAMAAMLENASKQPDQPVTIAIVDGQGGLLYYARMDNCSPIPQKLAIKKAYTAGVSGVDSQAFGERLKSGGMSVADLGDPNMVNAQGGVAIVRPSDGAVLGGIGVSGLSAQADEDLARLGVVAMNL